jgi:hypothetical protein
MPKTANNVPLLNHIARPGRLAFLGGLLLFANLWFPYRATAQTPKNCQSQVYDSLLRRQNRSYAEGRDLLNRLVLEKKASARTGATEAEEKIIIPVVVHVVHDNVSGTVGGLNNANLTNTQIRSQIEVLNEDYQRKEGTPGFNTNPVGANVNIEFQLATRNPLGGTTSGITRHYSPRASFATTEMNLLSEITYWPSDRYLNIWVTDLSEDFIGYAQFPDMTGLDGLAPQNGLATTDGVVIDYTAFGVITDPANRSVYKQGRTTTHEVGHWLGLLHTWGDIICDGAGCFCGEDFINDTPPAGEPNQTVECRELFSSCTGVRTRNMTENFMDYSPDKCMNVFTQGQKERIRQVLQLSPRRKALVEWAKRPAPERERLTVNVFPNPTDPQDRLVNVEVLLKGSQPVTITLFSSTGSLVHEQAYASTTSTTATLYLQAIRAGMYIVRISTPTETQIRRLVLMD